MVQSKSIASSAGSALPLSNGLVDNGFDTRKVLRFGTPDKFFKKSGEQEHARESSSDYPLIKLRTDREPPVLAAKISSYENPSCPSGRNRQPLVLADIATPSLKPGQVLVEIAFSGACGTQLMEIAGDKGEDKWCPHCLGHEGTGTVMEAAPESPKSKLATRSCCPGLGEGMEAGARL